MALLKGLLASAILFPTLVLAQEAMVKVLHDRPAVKGSIIANMLEKHDNPFVLLPYESNYLLYTDTSDINKEAIESYNWDKTKHDEVKFQLSLAFPLWRGILGENSVLGASYIQKSWWQLSNRSASSPFRETDYEPQVFLGWATDPSLGGWTLRDVETGVSHQSNGRADPTSRSWNRVYARLMAENGNCLVKVKLWYRIPENENNDDNPDITKYMGYYRLTVGYQWGENIFSVKSQYNWNSGYGGAELGWSYPMTKHVRFYTQVYSGYGESLIDHNHRQTRVGVGVTLNNLF